jgi:hypothetical protein
MPIVFIDRYCRKCKQKVPQLVVYDSSGDRVGIGMHWENCVVCQNPLPKPTEKEIRDSNYFIDGLR